MNTYYLSAEATTRKNVVRIIMYNSLSPKHIENIGEFHLLNWDFDGIVEYHYDMFRDADRIEDAFAINANFEWISDLTGEVEDTGELTLAECLEISLRNRQSNFVYDELGLSEEYYSGR